MERIPENPEYEAQIALWYEEMCKVNFGLCFIGGKYKDD